MFRQLETSGKLTLLWCFTENGFEQATKMKPGHACFARKDTGWNVGRRLFRAAIHVHRITG
jgi:hypothetical protein